jgi:NADPH2:quinone reductase
MMQTMNAVTFEAPGTPSVLSLNRVASPTGAPGHVVAEQAYADVNFGDVLYRRYGIYPAQSPPYVVGYGGAGVVCEVGRSNSGFAAGERVAYIARAGGYAERIAIPASQVVPLPPTIDLRAAAALVVAGTAAHEMLETAALSAGSTILVHGAAGGVGSFLVQLAHRRGLRPIAAVSSEEKAAFARDCGAADVVVTSDPGAWSAVAARVDAVFDSVGAAVGEVNLAALRRSGTILVYGAISGPASFDSFALMQKSLTVRGFALFEHLETWPATMRTLFAQVEVGDLRVPVRRVFPLAEAAAAHALLEARGVVGKILLSVPA